MIAGRIVDRFPIAENGTLYELNLSHGQNIKIGEILFDLRGNRFRVQAIEQITPAIDRLDWKFERESIGVLFELVDHVQVEGTLLFDDSEDVKKICFLFCNHPLYPQKVDEDYLEEYQVVKEKYPCALLSYEDLEKGTLSLYGDGISGMVVYRGWMMKPEMYRIFYRLLKDQGIYLINSPEEYENYHLLPNWYPDFHGKTAESVWETKGDLESAIQMTKDLKGSYLVKDYVKSRKHEWYDACYIENIANQESVRWVIGNFIERQGENLVGGVVLRKFERLKRIGFHEKSGMPLSEEYRVFLFVGRILKMGDYWTDQGERRLLPEEEKWVEEIAKMVKSNFVTIDLARRENGALMIMEFGDGQVSGLQQIHPKDFYQAFEKNLNKC